jgi:hypothetical protein
VALKVLLPALAADPEARRRFLREARAVASLCHENIVAIHHVGEEGGSPYLVMELLSGSSLAEWLAHGATPSVAEVVQIGRDVARGLAAAHARGLVHRDIKPANLWLQTVATSTAGRLPSTIYRTKILDFGLVRPTQESGGLTQFGTVVGTPSFVAPEQVAGKSVDARADLFSLGCVLYRLCTGRLPFPGEGLLGTLQALAVTTPPPVRACNSQVPPALNNLIMQLLARDPRQRPASAREVEETLDAIAFSLADTAPTVRQAITETEQRAGPAAAGRKRWPWLVLAALLLASGAAGLFSYLGTDRKPGPDVAVSGEKHAQVSLRLRGACLAHTNEIRCLAYSPDGRFLATGSFDRSAVIWDVAALQPLARLGEHEGVIEAVAFSPDSKRLVTACADGVLRLWTVPEGKRLAGRLAHKGGAAGVAFGRSASGSWLLVSGGEDGLVRLWQPDLSAERKALAGHKGRVDTVALSPDGARIASGGRDRTARVWDARTGRELAELPGYADRVSHLAFSLDGKILATAAADEQCVRLWDVACKREARSPLRHRGNVHGVDVHRDGRLLAAAAQRDGGVVIWDLVTGQRVDVAKGEAQWTWAVAFAPDGKSVAAGDFGILKVWSVGWSKQVR